MRSIPLLENVGNEENERRELTSLTNREVTGHKNLHHNYDRGDQKRLSRVLSRKANIAKSKTPIVVKMGAAKVCSFVCSFFSIFGCFYVLWDYCSFFFHGMQWFSFYF